MYRLYLLGGLQHSIQKHNKSLPKHFDACYLSTIPVSQPMQEYWWYVGQGGEASKEVAVKETTGLHVDDKAPDEGLVNALTAPDAPLAAGAMPKMGNLNESGEKALIESLTSTSVAKPKKRKAEKTPDDTAEEVTPKSPMQMVVDSKADLLKSATQARQYALTLEHLNYSGELVTGMMNFSKKMEACYKRITTLEAQKVTDDRTYKKIYNEIETDMAWYTQAEARV